MSFFGFFKRLKAISTPFGGVTWAEEKKEIPKFTGSVNLTWNDNRDFYDFLTANIGKTVGLSVMIDASVSVPSQSEIADESPEAFARIHDCQLSGAMVPLPNDSGMIVWLTFSLLDGRTLLASHGGTGIFQMPLKGIFDVVRTAHGGPAVHFHITEEVTDVAFRSAVFGG